MVYRVTHHRCNSQHFFRAAQAVTFPLARENIESKVHAFCLASRALGSLG
jgi:hypothetical protein